MSAKFKIPFLLISVVIFCACKKDKLKAEKSELIGTWEWMYSCHAYNWCTNVSGSDTLTPITAGKTFSFKCYEKGVIEYYVDDQLESEYRIVFDYYLADFEYSAPLKVQNADHFRIFLDNDENKIFSGHLNEMDLWTQNSQFPFVYNHDCEGYSTYFKKQ